MDSEALDLWRAGNFGEVNVTRIYLCLEWIPLTSEDRNGVGASGISREIPTLVIRPTNSSLPTLPRKDSFPRYDFPERKRASEWRIRSSFNWESVFRNLNTTS